MMAIFLNQSSVIFGVNISFADVFFAQGVLILFFNRCLKIPAIQTAFFIFLTVHTLFTSFIYVPAAFFYAPGLMSVLVGYIKLLVVFLYFVMGYNISLLQKNETAISWYSRIAMIVGVIGILFSAFNIRIFSSVLYYDDFRFKGLMNDPNFFAIIQASAIPYFSRQGQRGKRARAIMTALMALSVLASGSKTGAITLLCYFSLRLLEALRWPRIKRSSLLAVTAVMLILIIVIPVGGLMLQDMAGILMKSIPAIGRVILIFTDFDTAVSGMGSSRDLVWKASVNIIKMSPIMGVGLGTYTELSKIYFGVRNEAHNTYLQLISEWGGSTKHPAFCLYFLYSRQGYFYEKTSYCRKLNIT